MGSGDGKQPDDCSVSQVSLCDQVIEVNVNTLIYKTVRISSGTAHHPLLLCRTSLTGAKKLIGLFCMLNVFKNLIKRYLIQYLALDFHHVAKSNICVQEIYCGHTSTWPLIRSLFLTYN